MREEIYRNPGHVHFGVCDDHRQRDYEQYAYAQFRWKPYIPKDYYPSYDGDEDHSDRNVQ